MNARLWTLSLLLAPLFGCGDKKEFWLPKNDVLPMVALEDRVAFVERTSQTAFLLDPADPSLTPRQVRVGKAPVLAVKHNGANELLVLDKGDPGSASKPQIAAQLDRISDALVSYPLADRFDALAQSSDGRFLVIYHSPTGQAQADDPLFNPNKMTLVDFTPPAAPTVPTVTLKTISSLGGVPSAVVFSPPYVFSADTAAGDVDGRTLAAVLFQNYVTIIDLDHPDHTEISVPLCSQSSGCNLSPAQVLFDPRSPTADANHVSLYVRVSGARDIYQITLTDTGPTPAGSLDNAFSASLSLLAVGGTPADMALYGSGASTRLAVAAPDSRSLVIIDPSTSSATAVPTTIPVSQIIPFELEPLPPATKKRQQALLLDRQFGNPSVLFAEFDQVSTKGGLALQDYGLGAGVTDVQPLVGQGIVVLVGGKFSGSAAVTVVDLAGPSFAAFGTASELSLPTFEIRDPSRLWHVDQGTGLCYLDLAPRPKSAALPEGEARLTTAETWLDQAITGIVPLARPAAPRYVVVTHDDPYGLGNVTILDAEKPDRAQARAAYGFLLSQYLEREQP